MDQIVRASVQFQSIHTSINVGDRGKGDLSYITKLMEGMSVDQHQVIP